MINLIKLQPSYKIKMVLMNDDQEVWEENYTNMTLSDFEVLYGSIMYQIIYIEMRIQDGDHHRNDQDGESKRENGVHQN